MFNKIKGTAEDIKYYLNISVKELDKQFFIKEYIYELVIRKMGIWIGIFLFFICFLLAGKTETGKIFELLILTGIISILISKPGKFK